MQFKSFSDEQLIEMLQKGGKSRQNAWEYMFKQWRKNYLAPVLNNGGTEEDADQAISAICIAWEKTICQSKFELKSASLKTYLANSVYYTWLKSKKQSHKNTHQAISEELIEDVIQYPLAKEDIRGYLNDVLEKTVGERCRQILCLYAASYSMEEIGKTMNITPKSAKNQKYLCLKKLVDYFNANPSIAEKLKNLIYG